MDIDVGDYVMTHEGDECKILGLPGCSDEFPDCYRAEDTEDGLMGLFLPRELYSVVKKRNDDKQWDGSGLPPVGQRIEIQSPEDGSWSDAGEVTEIRTFVCTTSMRAGFNSTCNFRAARTKEQQLSDDLYALIYDRLPMIEAARLREEILERYNLEPK